MKYVFRILLISCAALFLQTYKGQTKIVDYDLEYRSANKEDHLIVEKMILDISDNTSVFRSLFERQSDSLIVVTGKGNGHKMGIEGQFYASVDRNNGEVIKSIQSPFKELFYVKINDQLNWEILPEKKLYKDIPVQKATIDYGGRQWTAWFATDIPLQFGPYIFNGLPGLIVEIYDHENHFTFRLLRIQDSLSKPFFREKGMELSLEGIKKMTPNEFSQPFAQIKQVDIP